MKCPYCKKEESRVVDSRAASGGFIIRRRRECPSCGRRFTTYERMEETPLRVVKKDGTREQFSREKIREGLLKACEKRKILTQTIEEALDRIELEVYARHEKEVPASVIGELVMEELRGIDQVAYVRFASVYREFKDVREFMEELRQIQK